MASHHERKDEYLVRATDHWEICHPAVFYINDESDPDDPSPKLRLAWSTRDHAFFCLRAEEVKQIE